MRASLLALGTLILFVAPGALAAEGHVRGGLRSFPLHFEANRGQADPEVRFIAKTPAWRLLLLDGEVRFAPGGGADAGRPAISMTFSGARSSSPRGEARLPGVTNYLVGPDPGRWLPGVPQYGSVRYAGVYDGIDVRLYPRGSTFEYDLILGPGAAAEAVALEFAGARLIDLERTGDLVLGASWGEVRMRKPAAYQVAGGRRLPVESRFRRLDGNRIGFTVGPHRDEIPLIIDPVLSFSTYVGGGGADVANGVAVDSAGNVYVTGYTESTTFPAVPGSYRTAAGGGRDAFVFKLSPNGSTLLYATYLGGTSNDRANAIAVNSAGNAYVGGTGGSGFPATAGAYRQRCCGAFVAKLAPDGSSLVYSTFLGSGEVYALAVDAGGNAYPAGLAYASFPVTPGAYQTAFGGVADAFVAKLDPAGGQLVYSTLLGGTSQDRAYGVAVDSGGNAYVAGTTYSNGFPTTPGAFQQTAGGQGDGFVAKLNASGSALSYSTLLGGAGRDEAYALALGSNGVAYATGLTASANFPTTAGAYLRAKPGSAYAGYVTALNPAGTAAEYSTFLGPVEDYYTTAFGIAVDPPGSAVVTGTTSSASFPVTSNVFQPHPGGAADAFVLRLRSGGASLSFSTYLGGSSADHGRAIALDAGGNVYVVGRTDSANLPTTPGALQPAAGPAGELFVAKIDGSSLSCSYTLSAASATLPPGGGQNSVGVTAGTGCAWTARSEVSWLTIRSGASGIGSGVVDFSAGANSGASSRAGKLIIAGNLFTVTQPGTSCSYSLSPTGTSYGSAGGAGSTSLNAPSGCAWSATADVPWILLGGAGSGSGSAAIPYEVLENTGGPRSGSIRVNGAVMTVSQGGHTGRIGVFQDGSWTLDANGDWAWDQGVNDKSFGLGWPGTKPVIGDWNGDGHDKAGVFSDGWWYLDYDGNGMWDGGIADRVCALGSTGMQPVVGDWNGDGKDEIGIYNGGYWYLDWNGNCAWDGGAYDRQITLGWSSATPVVGDWNGDGRSKVGVWGDGYWYLDVDGNGLWDWGVADRLVALGWPGVQPKVADWNGDGKDDIAIYDGGFWYQDLNGNGVWDGTPPDRLATLGWQGTVPVIGDWNGDGRADIGVFASGWWYLDYNGNGVWDGSGIDKLVAWGVAGNTPVAGRW